MKRKDIRPFSKADLKKYLEERNFCPLGNSLEFLDVLRERLGHSLQGVLIDVANLKWILDDELLNLKNYDPYFLTFAD